MDPSIISAGIGVFGVFLGVVTGNHLSKKSAAEFYERERQARETELRLSKIDEVLSLVNLTAKDMLIVLVKTTRTTLLVREP